MTFTAQPSTQRLWSVTSLIKLGLGTSDPLVNWAVGATAEAAIDNAKAWQSRLANEGRDSAVDYLKRVRFARTGKAQVRGTDLHKAAENLALGLPIAVDFAIIPYVEQFKQWLDVHGPRFVMAEAPVYNLTHRYAGTLDGIMELGGKRLLYDIKTTDKAPDSGKSRPPYAEVALQLCAYARAEQVGILSEQRYAGGKRYYVYDDTKPHEVMPPVDGAICIVVSPFDCFAVPVRIDESVWAAWKAVVRCAGWTLRGTSDLFGPPLHPDATELEHQLRASLEVTT